MQSSAKCLRLLGPQSLKIALAQKKGLTLAKGGAQRFINLRQYHGTLPAEKTSQLSSSFTSQSVFSEFDNAAGAVASGVHGASTSQQESSTSERKSSASTRVGLALGLGLTGALMLATRESEAAHAAGAPPTPSAVPPLQPGLTPLAPLGDHSTGPQTLNAGIPTAGVAPLAPGQAGSVPGQAVNTAGPLPSAGTAGAAGPFPPIAPLPGTQPPTTTTKKKVVKKRKKSLPNPGSIDKCAREVRNVTYTAMHIFGGARLSVNKRVFPAGADMPPQEPFAAAALQADPSTPTDKQLIIGTSLMAGNLQESQDGTAVRWTVRGILGKNKIHDLQAETDLHGGVMTGTWTWKAIPSYVTVRNQFMIGSDRNSMHNQVEYRGSDFTTRLGVSNGGQKFDADYMQSVLPSLALGSGIQFEWNKQVHLTHALRYRRVTKTHPQFKSRAAEADTAFVIYKDREVSAGYTRQMSQQVHLGSEVVYSPHSKESKCTVGVASLGQLVQMRSSIDTDGVVAVAMDQSLSDSMSFSLSAAVPHMQPQGSIFGFGLQIIM